MTGPTPADVHVPTAMGNGKKRKPLANKIVDTYKSGGLYVARLVQNVDQIKRWADSLNLVGFSSTMFDPDMHVTILHSDVGIPWENQSDTLTAKPIGWKTLGPDKALVILITSPELQARWQEAQDAGAMSTYDGYIPHVTLFYLEAGYDSLEYRDGDYPPLPPFDIVLGPEMSGDIDGNIFSKGLLDGSALTDTGRPTSAPTAPMAPQAGTLRIVCPVDKVDVEKRMIWGWASVVTKDGAPIIDRQGDIIELAVLEKAVWEFMDTSRVGGEMHKLLGIGTVVDSLVFSKEVQAALGIDLKKEGWFVGVRVDNDTTWDRVKKGELRSFSIGGKAVRVPA